MAQQTPEVIVYSYEMAPNPQKLFQFLALFNLPFKYVQIPATMPRPMLADIGITYRRTPLLSIGSDMYIDNALILEKVCELAQRNPPKDLEDTTNHVEFDGLGQEVFKCAAALIPPDWHFAKDPHFRADRSELTGRPFDPAVLVKVRPRTISKMLTLVNMVESHFLKDGKQFFLGGLTPTTADMHLYWSLNWGLRYHSGARPEISESTNPRIFSWLSDVDFFIKGRRCETKIDMAEACQVLLRLPMVDSVESVPHIKKNQEGLVQGQRVKITPVDTGKSHPQLGQLVSLNYEQVCLKNDRGLIMHFPRLGYEIQAVREENI
jgi:glutathione S-transferase